MKRSSDRNNDLAIEIGFYEGILAEDPEFVDVLVPLAEAYTKVGLYDKGLEADLKLARLQPDDPTVHYNLACSYALTGRRNEALAGLEHAIELGYADPGFMLEDADLVSLHEDERFAQLMERFFPDGGLDL